MSIETLPNSNQQHGWTRRNFLITTIGGLGGLCLGFHMTKNGLLPEVQAATDAMFNAYIKIDTDGTITVMFGGADFGQGTASGFCQVIAEELLPTSNDSKSQELWKQMRYIQIDASIDPKTGKANSYPIYYSGGTAVNILYGTAGSGALRNGNRFAILRTAGATAREMLISAGAEAMGVARDACAAIDGTIVAQLPDGTLASKTYGDLAAKAALLPVPTVTLADPVTLLDPKNTSFIGHEMPRLDTPPKTDGSAKFGLDIRLPGMLYAVVKHSPTLGGTLSRTPSLPSRAKYIFPLTAQDNRGAVRAGSTNAFAVVADNTWYALQGAKNARATWVLPPTSTLNSVDTNWLTSQAHTLMDNPSAPKLYGENNLGGNPDDYFPSSTTIEATYSFPYIPHVSMEVLNCTVKYDGTSCEVWAPTQNASSVVNTAKALTGFTGDKVIVHTTLLGGGNGRKIEQDYPSQAIQTAMALYAKTKPTPALVKTMWPREEDFTNDNNRPMALVRVKMGIDAAGNVSMLYRTVGPGISWRTLGPGDTYPQATTTKADSAAIDGAANSRYGITARRVEHVPLAAMIPIGYWRSVGASINPYALECALDELADKINLDPLSFRRMLFQKSGDTRALTVVNAAAALSPWRDTLPANHAWGVAYAEAFGTLICQVVDISQPAAGSIRVHRVACAVDCGIAVNPSFIEFQIQGSIAHGMSAAFWGQQKFTSGKGASKNFNTFKMVRSGDMPQVEISIVNSGAPIGGIGELGVPPIGPAISNAYFRLTKASTGVGMRFYNLPFFPNAGGLGGS